MSVSIEFDHHNETVENGQGMRRLELLGLDEQLRDPADRRVFFGAMTDDDYTRMTGYVNSITRGQPIDYGYYKSHVGPIHTPALEDKDPLMREALQAVRNILSEPQLDDRVALRRAGLTMAGADNYVHAKIDGNGRMGRVKHYLIEFGTERGPQAFEEELYAIIGGHKQYETDTCQALYNTPPTAVYSALGEVIKMRNPDWALMTKREFAAMRVRTFLEMMQGTTTVPVMGDVTWAALSKRRWQYFNPYGN